MYSTVNLVHECMPVYSVRGLVSFERRGWDRTVLENKEFDFHGGRGDAKEIPT